MVHYKLLKLYIELGLVIKEVHRVLQFRQEGWLSPYITLNSEKRQVAANMFEENFYKLMNNAVYGKNCESKRRRCKITMTRNAEQVLNVVSKFEFDRYMIFGENMAALTTRPKSIFWNTPTIVGATILSCVQTSTVAYYIVIRTTSYSVQSPDFYKLLSEKPQSVLSHFDFSNYPSDHFLFNASNKKVVLKFKDEFAGDYIHLLKAKAILHSVKK